MTLTSLLLLKKRQEVVLPELFSKQYQRVAGKVPFFLQIVTIQLLFPRKLWGVMLLFGKASHWALFPFFEGNFSVPLPTLSQWSNLWLFLILFCLCFLLYWVGPFQETFLLSTHPQTKLISHSNSVVVGTISYQVLEAFAPAFPQLI